MYNLLLFKCAIMDEPNDFYKIITYIAVKHMYNAFEEL